MARHVDPLRQALAVLAGSAPIIIYLAATSMFTALTPDPAVVRLQLAPPLLLWQPPPEAGSAMATPPPLRSLEVSAPGGSGKAPLMVTVEVKETAATATPTNYADVLVADMAARSTWLLASAGLLLAAVACFLFGVAASWVGAGGMGVAISLLLLGLGGVVGANDGLRANDPLREIVADCGTFGETDRERGGCPLNRIALGTGDNETEPAFFAYGAFDDGTLQAAKARVWWNAVIGTAATGLLAGAFGALAWPASSPSAENLRRRRLCYFLALGAGAALLSFAVAATHALFHWASALVQPEASAQLAALASTSTGQWGFVYTTILVASGGATALALHLAIDDAAAAATAAPNGASRTVARTASADAPAHSEEEEKGKEKEKEKGPSPPEQPSYADWLKNERLGFEPLKALAALLLTIAPLATSPLLDALKAAIG